MSHAPMPFRRALPWITFITVMYFLNFLSRGILAPLLVPMEKALGANHTEAASLMLFLSAGFGIGLPIAGWISSKMLHRSVIVLSIATLGISLAVLAVAPNIMVARAAYALFGLGTGFYMPSGMAALASISSQDYWGRTIAIHELAPNFAFIIAPLLAEGIMLYFSWRGALWVMSGSCIVGSVLFWMFGKGGEEYGTPLNASTLPELIKRPAFWAIMVLIGLGVGLESGPYSITPLYLVAERGMSSAEANSLIAITRLITPVTVLIGGWLADRAGLMPVLISTIAGSAVALVGMGLGEGILLSFSIMAQACMPALMFPAVFKAVTEAFGVEKQSLVLSTTMPVSIFVALGFIPTFLGWCGDQGHFGYGFVAVGGITAICLLVLPLLRK